MHTDTFLLCMITYAQRSSTRPSPPLPSTKGMSLEPYPVRIRAFL